MATRIEDLTKEQRDAWIKAHWGLMDKEARQRIINRLRG